MKKPALEVCAECQRWSERYHDLVKELLTMKRDGFMPSAQIPEIPTQPQLEPEIELAISERFDRRSVQAREQVDLAWAMKRAGKPAEEIAALITRGEPLEL